MARERVLICGAGVSGSIVAFWLAKHDFEVVVVERSKAEQNSGQGLEIEEPALTVVRTMGILEKLNERKTGEMGFNLLDERDRSYGIFETQNFGITGELEIMRGDLTDVLYKAADAFHNVTYHFETTIRSLEQTRDKAIVELENKKDKSIRFEEFDLVVGADGVKSRTRQFAMGSPEQLDCYKRIGISCAYFSIPKEDHDWPYSRLCNFPKNRIIWTRPVGKDSKIASVYLIHARDDNEKLRHANATGDRQKQKEAWAEVYSGLGWEAPRVIEQMLKSENFYSDALTQVKLQKWSQGRVVLVGDAAWAPTPLTGEGNQLAIIGAWVLAQELSRDRTSAAFEAYEKRFRSYVENAQQIPLGGYAPYIFNPQTTWAIWLLCNMMSFALLMFRAFTWTNLGRLLPEQQSHNPFDLEIKETESTEP